MPCTFPSAFAKDSNTSKIICFNLSSKCPFEISSLILFQVLFIGLHSTFSTFAFIPRIEKLFDSLNSK